MSLETPSDDDVDNTLMNGDASKVYGYTEDASELMYSCCKLTKLSMIERLLHIRCLNKVTDKVNVLLKRVSI